MTNCFQIFLESFFTFMHLSQVCVRQVSSMIWPKRRSSCFWWVTPSCSVKGTDCPGVTHWNGTVASSPSFSLSGRSWAEPAVSSWTKSCDLDLVRGRCNLKRSSISGADYDFQAWTYNLIRWGCAGDVTLDLSSLPPDGVLNRITGDDRGAWDGDTGRQENAG